MQFKILSLSRLKILFSPHIASDEEFDEEDPALLDELAQFEDEDQDFETAPAVQVQQPPVQSNRVMPIQPIQTQPSSTSGNSNTESAGQSLLVLLDSRIEMYTKAEKNAKANGEASRARRFARGLATLTDLRKKLKSGKGINEEDIPPAIGKKHALKEYDPISLNTSCFWASTVSTMYV